MRFGPASVLYDGPLSPSKPVDETNSDGFGEPSYGFQNTFREEHPMKCRTRASRTYACLTTLVCLSGSLLGQVAVADQDAVNLLPNASFEEGVGDQPRDWKTHTWSGKAGFEYAETGRTGNRCLLITSTDGADASWYAEAPVEPGAVYRLSGWIKTEGVKRKRGKGALLNLHNIQPIQTKALTDSNDWTKVEVLFETGGRDQVWVNCLLGGWGTVTGKAWFDDLRLEPLVSKDWKPRIAIDAAATGEPISKYIYGQFIEHLGRCIDGGIWAEMLQDRKFYFPIGAEYGPYLASKGAVEETPFPIVGASPWQIMGADDSVRMVTEDSFVGEQTPLIAAGGGIRQRDLGLIEGRRYVGYVWLKASQGDTRVQVALGWGEGAAGADRAMLGEVRGGFRKYPLGFTAGATTERGMLEISVTDGAACLVGTVSLMPADNLDGMRADTLALLKELDSPVYRWPGGNFVSGYDWADGIGDRDHRPPRKNPAWTGVEHNDFGIDEFMNFCRILKTEPYIAVNSGQGGVKSAVEELEYANGRADSAMGRLRAKNGHPRPYGVKWWGIGNEMYGGWQLGHMPLEDYVKKHNMFAEAFEAKDPSVALVAVGATGPWSVGMMTHCADHMDLISEHFYRHEGASLIAHVRQIPDAVRQKAEAHRRYRDEIKSLAGRDIRIALDEWNYWYGPHAFGELGTRYFLKDALGVAAGLNEFSRQSEMFFMANYAQTVNVIGCIKTSKTEAAFATTGLVLKLYRGRFGVLPVAVTADEPLDVAAALSEDRKTLTVAVVNPTMRELNVSLDVSGVSLAGTGRRWQIGGKDPMAYNEPGKAAAVVVEEDSVSGVGDELPVAGCSVTLYALTLK